MKKNFFLISFLPALVYWYLEENYPVKIAAAAGVGLALLEIFAEKIFLKHVHKISIFNFFLLFILGGLSVFADEGIWFKLQPGFTGVLIGGLLLSSKFRHKSFFKEMMLDMKMKQTPPEWVMETMEFQSGLFFFLYGVGMFFIAILAETSTWLFFKTLGFYLCFFVFMVFEILYLRHLMKKHLERVQMMKNLQRR
jgi:intracellular septation protein